MRNGKHIFYFQFFVCKLQCLFKQINTLCGALVRAIKPALIVDLFLYIKLETF